MLSLEACKFLAEMGFRQGNTHEYYGVETYPNGERRSWLECSEEYSRHHYLECYDCPSEIEALDWLEKELGYLWGRDAAGELHQGYYAFVPNIEDDILLEAATPSDLVLAINAEVSGTLPR